MPWTISGALPAIWRPISAVLAMTVVAFNFLPVLLSKLTKQPLPVAEEL